MKHKEKIRNFVAKHAQNVGAGCHEEKHGKRAKRARQKEQVRRELKFMESF